VSLTLLPPLPPSPLVASVFSQQVTIASELIATGDAVVGSGSLTLTDTALVRTGHNLLTTDAWLGHERIHLQGSAEGGKGSPHGDGSP